MFLIDYYVVFGGPLLSVTKTRINPATFTRLGLIICCNLYPASNVFITIIRHRQVNEMLQFSALIMS